jgi:ABC-2 type transport system ATP-binding protein
MHAAATALDISRLGKRYGTTEAGLRCDFKVQAATTLGLVGANGAGSTPLINCMLAFCDLDPGDIAIFGVPSYRNESRRRLAFLPESFVPAYYLTGNDFLKFMAGVYERHIDLDKCIRTLASVDLDPKALGGPVRARQKG